MKRFLGVLLACCMVLSECGAEDISSTDEPNTINGYEEADYEKFNSPAEENGLGGIPIYVEGTVETKVTAKKVLAFTLRQDDGNYWVVSVTDRPKKDRKIVDDVIDKYVRVFGEYVGYSDTYKMPALAMSVDGGKLTVKNDKSGDGYRKVWDFDTYLSERTQNLGEESQKETEEVVEPEPQETEPQNAINPEPDTNLTMGQQNALRSALQYLSHSPFSHDGLVEQLEYEGYTSEEAVYAADNCGADWNEQALKSANSYLGHSAFSHQGLVDQLLYEGFTSEQATYGADNCGADWNEQAAKSAKNYLDTTSFSRDSLIGQLEYEGFTHEQAVYGVEQNGY